MPVDPVIISDYPELFSCFLKAFPSSAVSSTHAMIDHINGEYWLTDLSSTNGTFLDGEECLPGKPTRLTPGVEIIFGDEFMAKFVLEAVGGSLDDQRR